MMNKHLKHLKKHLWLSQWQLNVNYSWKLEHLQPLEWNWAVLLIRELGSTQANREGKLPTNSYQEEDTKYCWYCWLDLQPRKQFVDANIDMKVCHCPTPRWVCCEKMTIITLTPRGKGARRWKKMKSYIYLKYLLVYKRRGNCWNLWEPQLMSRTSTCIHKHKLLQIPRHKRMNNTEEPYPILVKHKRFAVGHQELFTFDNILMIIWAHTVTDLAGNLESLSLGGSDNLPWPFVIIFKSI